MKELQDLDYQESEAIHETDFEESTMLLSLSRDLTTGLVDANLVKTIPMALRRKEDRTHRRNTHQPVQKQVGIIRT